MHIHIIPNQKFTLKFLELLETKYSPDSNLVYIYGKDNFVNKELSFIKYIDSFEDIDLSLLTKKDKLFVHSFFYRDLQKYLLKNSNKFTKNQLVLIIWGGEIYDDRIILEDGKLHLRLRMFEYTKKRLVKKAGIFMTFAASDYEIAKKYYGAKGKQFDCLYLSNADVEYLDEIRKTKTPSDFCRVLLGNSATDTNQHVEMLDVLSKFKNDYMEIICPLSYGDLEYAEYVEKYGKNIFGERFIAIREYMSIDDYSKLLNSVDIAIFNNNRQQATGNIEILAYLGKKMFIRSDTTTWEHYVKRDKCKFYDAIEIKNLTFNQFKSNKNEDVLVNEEYFRKIWDTDYIKSLWDMVMDYS